MAKKNITKFPEGFFQQKRPIISAGEAVKGLKPLNGKVLLILMKRKQRKQKTRIREIKNKIIKISLHDSAP